MDTLADGALAARIAASPADAEAEGELYRRFARRVRLYGLKHLRDEAAADDLVQEVLALTLTRLRQGALRDPGKLASFVLGSCRLVVRNVSRTEARRRQLLGHLAAEPRRASEQVRQAEDQQLAACLGELAERARTVVVLTYYADRTAAEIAEELGLSPGNVRVVRHRALTRLLACMTRAREVP